MPWNQVCSPVVYMAFMYSAMAGRLGSTVTSGCCE